MDLHENNISFAVRGGAFEVYNYFGPGLFESVYEAALANNLQSKGHEVKRQVQVPVSYNGQNLGIGFRMDLLVEEQVIVEVKSIESLHDIHHKQLLTYLKLTDLKLGLLLNFNEARFTYGIKRIVNGL